MDSSQCSLQSGRWLLSGNEAVAHAALAGGIALGTGYPGTPSTEILENFSALGGRAQWAPNEKVGLEVGLGAAFAGGRALVTMKHVGLNVAADPLFTAAYTGVDAALVIVSADDPGMASSQNEQDNRRYAEAAALPMLEPSDSQEAYEFMLAAIEISERWHIPVLLRMTTRVCHSKTVVTLDGATDSPGSAESGCTAESGCISPPAAPHFRRDIKGRVMIPAYARPAHRRLRAKLAEIAAWAETSPINRVIPGDSEGQPAKLGIIASGISVMLAREAAPEADVLKLGLTYPLPAKLIRDFAGAHARTVVVEEGDPYLATAIRAAGVAIDAAPEIFRFGELNVGRVRRLLAGDATPETAPPPGKPPQLCNGCSHGFVFELLHKHSCIVAGDIGCYTLGVLPPHEAMDTCVCMGASITVGLGMRHVLPPEQARRVVSVIGDSTFVHSGITGLVEMVYNKPPTGHVVLILDNGTTAMTGQQEHPGTGRSLDHAPAGKISFEDLARSLGIANVHVIDPTRATDTLEATLTAALAADDLTVIITRRPCLLAAGKIKEYERTAGAYNEQPES